MGELCLGLSALLLMPALLWLAWFLWQDWRLRRALRRLDQPPSRPCNGQGQGG